MLLPVALLSGRRVEVALHVGSSVHELKQELGKQLSVEPVRLRILAGIDELKDSATVSVCANLQAVIGPSLSWLDDGSECIRDLGGGAFSVVGEPDRLAGAHARCCYGCSHGEQYFEVEVLSGKRLSVGISTREGFKAGLKLNALSLNSREMRHLMGETVKTGDVIGVLLELSGLEVTATIWHNHRCLGPAFSALRASADTPLYPVVSAFEPGDCCNIRFGTCPFSTSSCETKAKPRSAHPLRGSWSLQSLQHGPGFEDPGIPQLSNGRAIVLEAEPSSAASQAGLLLRALCAIAGTFMVALDLRLTAVDTLGLLAICRHWILPWTHRCGVLWITSSFSAMTGGGHADQELERRVRAALEQATAWRFEDFVGQAGQLLVLTGPVAKLAWLRRDEP